MSTTSIRAGWNDAARTTPGPSADWSAEIRKVDLAVRSVLGRLPGGRARADSVDVFPGRLLALRHAEALPASLPEVRIAPGTVVTPLARDFLKRQGIGIRLVSRAEAESVMRPGEWGFAVDEADGLLEAFRRSLLEDSLPWSELEPGTGALGGWVAGGPDRGALLLTREASVAVWQLNQQRQVRAAAAGEPEAVARAVRSLGVNVLVVEPPGKSLALLRQLASTYRRGGAPRRPDDLGPEGPR